jgi:hypothetical protein
MAEPYIYPDTRVHSDYDSAEAFFDKGTYWFLERSEPLPIGELTQERRCVIVGEPGIGKTLLLKQLFERRKAAGISAQLLSLRDRNILNAISRFERKKYQALFLDGLDEVRADDLNQVLKGIAALASTGVDLIVSSRWVFIKKFAQFFPGFHFISVAPFSEEQAREYLKSAGQSDSDADALIRRKLSFNHRNAIIQIPRYLSYLTSFLKEKGISAASKVSRNELFEYFVYRKLQLEEEKLSTEKRSILKRVLEKLALVMEVYQTNVITKDELMTFFDDVKSDLTAAALAQVPLETLFNFSLLKNNPDSVEFENTEFQEYLAAKEITRFADPSRATFEFAADPDAKEIYPIWVNTLTFLVDMVPELLEQLVDFSGVRRTGFKVVDDAFWQFLNRVDTSQLTAATRRQLFRDLQEYQKRTRQWLRRDIASGMAEFFDESLEEDLKKWGSEANREIGSSRFISLGNVCYVVGHILEQKKALDIPYWKPLLIAWAADSNPNGVLQRNALFALAELGDKTVVDELPNLLDSDELIAREFVLMCRKVAPDHPKSRGYFVEAVKRGEFYGGDGIFSFREKASIRFLFEVLVSDPAFRRELLDHKSWHRKRDLLFWRNVGFLFDYDLAQNGAELLAVAALDDLTVHTKEVEFMREVWRLAKKHDVTFLSKVLKRIRDTERSSIPFWAGQFIAALLESSDVPPFLEWCLQNDEKGFGFSTLRSISFSDRADAKEIYEKGREFLPTEYATQDLQDAKDRRKRSKDTSEKKVLKRLRRFLEPPTGQWYPAVFRYFNENANQLLPLLKSSDRERLTTTAETFVFSRIDPVQYDLTITREEGGSTTYTTSNAVYSFRDALQTAAHLKLDLKKFRQKVINFIPFAYYDDLQTVFQLVPEVSPAEMSPVLDVYRSSKSDLWRHQPLSFVQAVERYRLHAAAPVLRAFVDEEKFDEYCRVQALSTLESLLPEQSFLERTFHKFADGTNKTHQAIAAEANRLLIVAHDNAQAVEWRYNQVINRAAEFVRVKGFHFVGAGESEIHEKNFAAPLMKLRSAKYESLFLQIIDRSLELWQRGSGFYQYAQYLWEITFAYFDNRKTEGSYSPLRELEKKISAVSHKEGANWLGARMLELRRAYLLYLGKPKNIAGAIGRYNEARVRQDRRIRNSADLFSHLQDALDNDIRRWVEGEGAYGIITGAKVFEGRKQEYEKLIQRTLKAQIENVLLKRGFQVEVVREAELLNDKQIDFLVRYGFAGPVIIEVKLTSNKDIQGKKIDQSPSYESMRRYMEGFGALFGLLLVFDNSNAKNLAHVKKTFQSISGVSVLSFACSVASKKQDKATRGVKR